MSERSWLQNLIWLYDYMSPPGIIGYGLIVASVPTTVWNFLEPAGVTGSPLLLLGLILLGIVLALSVALIASLLKWWLLFEAIKSYIKKYLLRRLTDKEILLGIGPGGAIAVGMVAKAIRVLGYEPPSVVVIDHHYDRIGADPSIGTLIAPELKLPKERCWIVQGHIGSGRSLRVFRERLNLQDVPVFAFVVSKEAAAREKIDAALAVGSRSILPWPTEEAHSK
ncbi:MAG: hypothetical protein M5U01_00380 [Ardenticatenaceae bacterium]|nr:hypothetical protein [Ardenticatenaceae bacterium]